MTRLSRSLIKWRFGFAIAVFFIVFSSGPVNAKDTPFVRVEVEPEQAIVGQAVTITVDVLVPNFFQGAPRFGDIELSDALVVFNDRGVNLSESIDGKTWAGQRRSYEIYPQRPGDYVIDNLTVTVAYFDGSARTESSARAAPFTFTAIIPPEAEGLGYFIAASSLTIEDGFDTRPDTIRVGDAFTRTITVSIEDALAMVIPPLPIDSINGLSIYRDPAVVEDDSRERGGTARGRRVERMVYVAQAEGRYALPPVSLSFWDAGRRNLRQRSTDRVSFVVLPALDVEPEFAAGELIDEQDYPQRGRRLSLGSLFRHWGLPFLALVLSAVIVVRVGSRVFWGVRLLLRTIVAHYRATNRPLQPLNPAPKTRRK